MSLLTAARRRSGVLAPAQFACLKLIDRSLWYALHSLGFEGDGLGQTTHPNPRIEAAGARDHWAAERIAGRPLVIPSVSRAVRAVRTSLDQDDANARSLEVP
jgi:intracellular multiplication protein IcmP